jgi:hypothetical protein
MALAVAIHVVAAVTYLLLAGMRCRTRLRMIKIP